MVPSARVVEGTSFSLPSHRQKSFSALSKKAFLLSARNFSAFSKKFFSLQQETALFSARNCPEKVSNDTLQCIQG